MEHIELRAVFEHTNDAVVVCSSDGLIAQINPPACHLLDAPAATLLGRHLPSLMPQPAHWASLFGGPHATDELPLTQLPARDARPALRVCARRVSCGNDAQLIFINPLDIPSAAQLPPTQGHMLERIVAEVERLDANRLQFVIDTIPALVAYVDAQQRYRFINRQCEVWYGLPPGAVINRPAEQILGDAYAQLQRWIQAALAGDAVRQELLIDYPAGARYVRISFTPDRDANGAVCGYVALVEDLSEQRAVEVALRDREARSRHQANHDPLTELPNRARFGEHLDAAIARGHTHQRLIALMFVDIDGFKAINDAYGHDAGDALLKVVARRLRGCARAEDAVGRFAGDEFLMIAEDLKTPGDAALFAQRVMTAIAQPIAYDKHIIDVSVSIGISLFPEDAIDAETLLRTADKAMYRAKRAGKNRYLRHANDTDAVAP